MREGMEAIGIRCGPRGAGKSALVVISCLRYANKRWNSLRTAPLSGGREAKISLWGTAQCAASNRPLPGAETALILYHRYSCGSDPPGERSKAGFLPATPSRAQARESATFDQAHRPVGSVQAFALARFAQF